MTKRDQRLRSTLKGIIRQAELIYEDWDNGGSYDQIGIDIDDFVTDLKEYWKKRYTNAMLHSK